jgi:diacylglycerol O-acyltransferase
MPASMAGYERLSALDAMFLGIEDENCHMHVAATMVFDGAPLADDHGRLDMGRIRRYLQSRLHLVPRYRQRLSWIPYQRHPVWVDDARFNIFYHVRHTALPAPGSERQLKRLLGRILSQKLDLSKPLWEWWVIEGLERGRVAMVAKGHHAMVDGISGMGILTALLSPSPEPDFTPGPPWSPKPRPSHARLLVDEAWRRGSAAFDAAVATARSAVRPWAALGSLAETVRGMAEVVGVGLRAASFTPLNPPLGPHRRYDWLRFDLGSVKAVKRALGGTVNDVVLAVVAGAVRRFLLGRDVRPDGLEFRALVPVSLHMANETGVVGNRVANMIARLPVGGGNAERRYYDVVDHMQVLKRSQQVRGSELLESFADRFAPSVLASIVQLALTGLTYNLVVTNVPGPQQPLYMLGAPLLEFYPMVPLFRNQGLGVALFSYAGGLYWGLNADWDGLPDLHAFTTALGAEFEEISSLANQRGAVPHALPLRRTLATEEGNGPHRAPAATTNRTPQRNGGESPYR